MRKFRKEFARIFGVGLVAGLILAHVILLGRRILDGTLLEPLVAFQWLATLSVAALAVILKRRGMSLYRGRSAVACWVLLAVAHGIVALPGGPGFAGVLLAEPWIAALPLGFSAVASVFTLLSTLVVRNVGALPKSGSVVLRLPRRGPFAVLAIQAARPPPLFV